MSVKILLKKDVAGLGKFGSVVTVRGGYARNHLIPTQKASLATKDNIEHFEKHKETLMQENLLTSSKAQVALEMLNGITLDFFREAADDGKLYGSVTQKDISVMLSEKLSSIDFTISSDSVLMNDRIKSLGCYDVSVILHSEIKAPVVVNVLRFIHV